MLLVCDTGARYLNTYYDDAWLAESGHDVRPFIERLERLFDTGTW